MGNSRQETRQQRRARERTEAKGHAPRTNHLPIIWIGGLVLLALIAIVGNAIVGRSNAPTVNNNTQTRSSRTPKVSPSVTRRAEITRWAKARYKAGSGDVWLDGTEGPQQFIDRTSAFEDRVRGLLDRYRDVSADTAKIHAAFRDFESTRFVNGMAMTIVTSEADVQALISGMTTKKKLEVCVVLPADKKRYNLPSPLYYRSEWGAVMTTAIEIPDAFLAALMYHEMGHAHKHQIERAPSATSPTRDDAWVYEEVWTHLIQDDVLNAAVQGRLTALYDRIIARAKDRDINTMIARITDDDLIEFETMFEFRNAGIDMVSVYHGHFLLAIGLRAMATWHSDPAVVRSEQINYYRWIARI